MADPSQILVLRLSSVGDVLLSTPVVRVLRRRYPRARLRFLVKPPYADLVRLNPHVDEVVTWPEARPRAISPEQARRPAADTQRSAGLMSPEVRALARRLRDGGVTWLVDLQASPRSRTFERLLRPERSFTYPKPYVRRHLLLRLKRDRFARPSRSVAERYFDALRPLGLGPDGEGLELITGSEADARAAEVLGTSAELGAAAGSGLAVAAPAGGWIAVAPGARWATKRWPPASFAAAARELCAQTGAAAVVVGGPGDVAAVRTVHAMLEHGGVRSVAPGDLSLLESAAVLRGCRVLLANDSGATHLAAAVGTPVVTLFGSTVSQFGFAPYAVEARTLGVDGLPCRPCTHVGRPACPLGHFKCMRELAPSEAVAGATELMAGADRARAGRPA